MAAEIPLVVPERIVDALTEVFIIQQFKDCYNLEENHELLIANIKTMETKLKDVHDGSQNARPVSLQECITKMKGEVEKAEDLRDRVEKRRSWCFDCWNLSYPKLSTECREWKRRFDNLFKELHNEIQFAANMKQLTPAPEPRLDLLQPVPDAGFVGSDIKDAEMQLRRWLAEPPHRVVGVRGMGGIGKTSLLKIIHNHFQKVSRIFEIVIWVVVSQNFKVEGFYNSIAKALDLKLDEKIDSNKVRTEVLTFLENKKILLILDDLWEPIDFDEVGFSFVNVDKGSKVLISTRSAEVIAAMRAKDSCWEMKLLSEEEAWQMFKSKAFTDGPAALDTDIEPIAREIAKKCQRLPLALKAVGAAMISNDTKETWSRALTGMGITADQDFQVNIDKQLRSSYDLLPKELKICFLYCAAFPVDAEIDADRLVEIWIAEGLLRDGQTTQLMDLGRYYLDRLAKRCLIDYYGVPSYRYDRLGQRRTSYRYDRLGQRRIKVHDVLREMAIRIGKSEEHCLFATNRHLTDFPGEIEVSNCKRISLGHNDIQDLPNNLMKCPNLVSLLLPSNWKLSHVPEQFLLSVTSLRVLDLSNTGITGLPISVGELRLLEFLDLSHCEELIVLPESIGNLTALQFFNLNNCEMLEGLPSTIRGCKKLKHLTLTGCSGSLKGCKKLKHLTLTGCSGSLKVNSDDIGQLTSLNRLLLPKDATLRAGDLINLTKMLMLEASVTADGGDVTIDTWTEMKDLTLYFKSDGVKIEKIERVETLQLYSYGGVTLPNCQFQYLKVLQMRGCTELGELPLRSFPMLTVLDLDTLTKLERFSGRSNVWNEGSMSKLEQLRIGYCPLLKLPLGMRLPNLKVLNIEGCDSITELDIGNGDFPMLKRLQLQWLNQLKSITGSSGSITGSSGVWNEEATSKLESVDILCCPLLKKLPFGMRLPNLKVLKIWHCDSIKELDIGNGDFPKRLDLWELKELEGTSKLERVQIHDCPLLRRKEIKDENESDD